MEIKNKKVAIIGFGLEGRDALNYFQKYGAKVSVFDQKEKKELELKGVEVSTVKFYCGKKYDLNLLHNFDLVVRSPGVYRFLPELLDCDKLKISVASTMQVFFENCPSKIIGVTGTKGKGTTSTLIYEILKKSGFDVYLAGNIGKPCLELLTKLKKDSWVVLELSSFQLIDLRISPHIAVILNITLDHMDWHKDRNEYINAKKNIVLHQKPDDFAVINTDYPISKKFQKMGSGKKYFFSKMRKVRGSYVKSGTIYFEESEIGNVKNLLLRGQHNWENITGAVCAARLAKATISSIKECVFSFKGLEHRLELIRNIKGVGFYNDSFSTNPQTTIAAVNSFNEPITLILGGYDKNLNYDEMARSISRSKVKNCILIGDISNKIKKSLISAKYKGNLIEMGYSAMDKIAKKCFEVAEEGEVVVLSPATSSFDMFENYKVRGLEFKRAVKSL